MKTELNWIAFYTIPNLRPAPFSIAARSRRWRPQRPSRRLDSIPLLSRPMRRSARWRELA